MQDPVIPSAENLVPRDLSPRPSTHSKLLYLLRWPSPQSIKNKL